MRNPDWKILYFIQKHLRCKVLDIFAVIISMLGSAFGLSGIFILPLMFMKDYKLTANLIVIAMGLSTLLCDCIIKPWVRRKRPCWIDTTVNVPRNPDDYSFPSGHTMKSVMIAVMYAALFPAFGSYLYIFAVLVGLSRMYLFVHFPSDVLAGALLGWLIGELCLWFGLPLL